MKRGTLIEIVLANIGGLFYAMGMCMILIHHWNLFFVGVVLAILGILNIAALIPVRKYFNTEKEMPWKTVFARFFMIMAAIAIVLGISQMIEKKNVILGLIIWIIGLSVSILSFPIFEYIKKDKEKLVKTVLGTVGSILLMVGLSMTFISHWNLVFSGTIVGLAGVILVIVFVFISKKENEEYYYINIKFIAFIVIEVLGAFLTVFGIVEICSSDTSMYGYQSILISGLICCGIGFLISGLAIPIYVYFKSNNMVNKGLKINLKNKENEYLFRNLIFMFFIYGFLGWVVECSFFLFTNGIVVNRGFLHLPILPIYGFGGIIVTLIFRKNQENVFIKSAILASLLEYVTSFILEKKFGYRWWDYSGNPLNINGRICLLNSLMFGLGGYAIAKFISPYINIKLKQRNPKLIYVLDFFIVVAVSTDFIYSLFNVHEGVGITTISSLVLSNFL